MSSIEADDFPENLLDLPLNDLTEIEAQMTEAGWKPVDFAFSLGRHTGALDLQNGNQRVLIYHVTPEDLAAYKILGHNDIPRFDVISAVDTEGTENGPQTLAIVKLPTITKALDSLRYPNQYSSTSHLGSIEIMEAAATFLAKLYKKTGMLPATTVLDNLALIPGEENMIRLIPPVNIINATSWEKTTQDLFRSLQSHDPQRRDEKRHEAQIEAFKQKFQECLMNND